MAKAYYISPIVRTNNGTAEEPDWEDRLAVQDHRVAGMAVVYPTEQNAGKRPCALVIVTAAQHAPMRGNPRLGVLPELSRDATIGNLGASVRGRMNSMLQGFGFNIDWTSSDTYREVLERIGMQLNPAFREADFDVSEAEAADAAPAG